MNFNQNEPINESAILSYEGLIEYTKHGFWLTKHFFELTY
jgi:hypothetical protein